MRGKKGIVLTVAGYTALIIYFIYEARYIMGTRLYTEFLSMYLYSIYKMLLNINLLMVFFVYYRRIPFWKPEYRVRYNVRLGNAMIADICVSVFFVCLINIAVFAAASFCFEGSFLNAVFLKSIMLVFAYAFCWLIIEKTIAFLTEKEAAAIAFTGLLSMIVSLVLGNFEFMTDSFRKDEIIAACTMAMSGASLLLMLLFDRILRKKECLA